jgi:capsid protein
MKTQNEQYAAALMAMVGPAPTSFAYDAVTENKGRRKVPNPITRSEDRELYQNQRRQLISGSRDLQRNFSIGAWAIRKHLDYVSTFKFKAKTGNPEVDDQLEALIDWWSRPGNCDAASRHSLPRFVRLLEQTRTIDGDVLVNLLPGGQMQAVEGDRVRNPFGNLPEGLDVNKLVHGVVTDDYGKAIAFVVCRRPRLSDDLVYDRVLSAQYSRLFGYFHRFDQVRGVSPLASALNSFRDVYEGVGYALMKAKVAQLFALAFTRDGNDPIGPIDSEETDADNAAPRYKVDFNGGPTILDLDPGDAAEFLESKTPSTEFQSFTSEVIVMALKSLDIPACFYDEARANFSSGRQGWILYDQSAQSKRKDLRELLDWVTAWRVKMFIVDGDLKLPAGFKATDVKWDWIHAGIPWIDPLKEATANTVEINSALNSRQRICKERGEDFFEIVDELAEESDYLKSKGIELKETPVSLVVTSDDGNGDKQDKANGK